MSKTLLYCAMASLLSGSAAAVHCTAKLAGTWTGPSDTCAGATSKHFWPIGDTSLCHGWQAFDSTGKEHDNAANNIRCSADGTSLLYDQYAGNLDCSGSPVSKSFKFGECHAGIPAPLHDTATDLNCCTNPGGAACAALGDVPSVILNEGMTGGDIYQNGELCTFGDDSYYDYDSNLSASNCDADEDCVDGEICDCVSYRRRRNRLRNLLFGGQTQLSSGPGDELCLCVPLENYSSEPSADPTEGSTAPPTTGEVYAYAPTMGTAPPTTAPPTMAPATDPPTRAGSNMGPRGR